MATNNKTMSFSIMLGEDKEEISTQVKLQAVMALYCKIVNGQYNWDLEAYHAPDGELMYPDEALTVLFGATKYLLQNAQNLSLPVWKREYIVKFIDDILSAPDDQSNFLQTVVNRMGIKIISASNKEVLQ